MKKRKRPPILEPNKRIVRQVAFFGCVICGNPLIEYAHIIPYEKSHNNEPENLVALCPNNHTEYDLGAFSEAEIRNYKANPFNRGRDIKKTFNILGSTPVIEAGTNICNNTPVLLVIDDKNIVTLQKENNQLTLNALFYDSSDKLVAYIKNNEWCALNNKAWDITYQTIAKNLTIRTKSRDILLKLKISKGVVHFSGRLYYHGYKVIISPNRIAVGNNVCFLYGCRFTNLVTVVAVNTNKGSIVIGSSVHEHISKTPLILYLRQGKYPLYTSFFVQRGCKFCGKF